MNDTRSRIVLAMYSLVPYALVSWAYMALVDRSTTEFWSAFGVLIAARTFFSIIEGLGGILSWRLYGKQVTVQKFLHFLRSNDFPKREYAHDDFLNYLARIEDEPEYSTSAKAAAKEIHVLLAAYESTGILVGARMHAASDAALDLYSPKSIAPIFGAPAA
jgi:hypothetical protein